MSISSYVEYEIGNIDIAIAMTDIPKLNLWKSKLQNARYSNVFIISMFGNQAPTLLICITSAVQVAAVRCNLAPEFGGLFIMK